MQVLETQRLVLREIEAADAPFILELHTDPSFLANIGDRGVHDLPSAENYIETNPRASYARNGYGNSGYVNDGRVTAYDVTYEYAGRQFVTRTNYHPGDRIRVRVDVRPE